MLKELLMISDIKDIISGTFKNLTKFQVYHPEKRESDDTEFGHLLIQAGHNVLRELTNRGRQHSVF